MSKSLLETMEEENNVARAKAEQVKQVKEAIEYNTKTETELKQQQESQQKQYKELCDQIATIDREFAKLSHLILSFNSNFETLNKEQKNQYNNFSNQLKDSIDTLSKNIYQNTSSIFENSFEKIKSNTNQFNSYIDKANENIKNNCDNLSNNFNELFNDFNLSIKENQNKLNGKIKALFFSSVFAFFFLFLFSVLNLMYNINYQFHCIKWLDTMQVPDFVNWLINSVVAIAIYTLVRAVISHFKSR